MNDLHVARSCALRRVDLDSLQVVICFPAHCVLDYSVRESRHVRDCLRGKLMADEAHGFFYLFSFPILVVRMGEACRIFGHHGR